MWSMPLMISCRRRRWRAPSARSLESALATRYEAGGILNNDMLNFLNTAVAAALAVVVVLETAPCSP